MKKIVLSGINMVDGGALSIYYDFLDALLSQNEKYKIYALVSRKELFDKYADKVEIREFPLSKKNWLFRLYYEYIKFKNISKKINPDIWISLHDMTPNVVAKKRFVYCHNPSPFNKMKITEIKFGLKYYLFSKFYKYLYAVNIHKNDAVIVQQDWMREEFKKMYNLKNIIVARPSIVRFPQIENNTNKENDKVIFVYPSFPRYYKNFQVVCKAAEVLKKKKIENFEIYITIDGSENKYAKMIVSEFKENDNINFCGILKREDLYQLYSKSSCLLFFSKLETWGMPILEFKKTKKPMILANLPYAHETIGEYKGVTFVDVDDYNVLAEKMQYVIKNKEIKNFTEQAIIEEPFANNWNSLINLIM